MPIVLAVNGVVASYPLRAGGTRPTRVDSVEAEDDPTRHPPSQDPSLQAAQSAYQQHTSQKQQPRPAILARDLMTTPAYALPSDRTLFDAWTLMSHKGFRHLPITSLHGTVVGIVSDRDLLRHAPDVVLTGHPGQSGLRRLAEVMTSRVISATPLTEIREIARVMLDEHIHAVPILDGQRQLVGILARRDLLRGMANHGPLELWT